MQPLWLQPVPLILDVMVPSIFCGACTIVLTGIQSSISTLIVFFFSMPDTCSSPLMVRHSRCQLHPQHAIK